MAYMWRVSVISFIIFLQIAINSIAGNDIIFVTDIVDGTIWTGPVATLELTQVPLESAIIQPVAVDYDPVEDRIYWTDVELETINRAFVNGTGQEVIVGSLSAPDGLTLDTENRHIYWTDTGTDKIERVDLDGSNRTIISEDDHYEPRAIVVDPTGQHIYWTDWGAWNQRIERAKLDGTGREVLVRSGLLYPNGIAVSFEDQRIYWCDAGLNLIQSVNLNGQRRKVHFFVRNIDIHPFDIAVYNNSIYWTDWALPNIVELPYGALEAELVGPGIFKRAGGFHIHQEHDGSCASNECKNDGICRQLVTGYRCECLQGFTGTYCEIIIVEETTTSVIEASTTFIVDEIGLTGKVATQSSEYSANTYAGRAINGITAGHTTTTMGQESCTHTGRDHGAWWMVDLGKNECIGSVLIYNRQDCCAERLSGAVIHIGSDSNRNNPTCIGTVPGTTDLITMSCNLEGRYISVHLPSNIAEVLTLCEVRAFRGNCNHVFTQSTPAANPCDFGPCKNGATCFNAHAGVGRNYICVCAEGYTGTDCETPLNAAPVTCAPDQFQCHDHSCIPNTYLCDTQFDCIEGEDEFNCPQPYAACIPEFFGLTRCPGLNNAACIFPEWICDQENDCRDGSDETHDICGVLGTCSADLFTCANSICIQQAWVCDQDNDCGDSSDEQNCATAICSPTTDFTCGNGRCVNKNKLCDGTNDCRDYTDEDTRYCTALITEPPRCGGGQIMCQGVCVLPQDCVINQCELFPSVCSQICTFDTRVRTFTCSCEWGYDLQPDGYTCIAKSKTDKDRPEASPELLFCNKFYIRKTGVTYDPNAGNGTIVGEDFGFMVAFDYDYEGNKIYMSDVSTHRILSMNMDGTDRQEVIKGRVYSVEGIAVDWVTEKLYWTDRQYDVLEVANLDGSMRKTLVRENMFEPRGCAVDPRQGHRYVYWTDWGLNAYIGRIGMDGTNEQELHSEDIVWPNGITIDYPGNKIYWTDAHLDYIAYADLDFSNSHRVLSDALSHTIAHPFSVSIFEDTMYWTDWNEFRVYKANKRDGSRMEVLLDGLVHRPMDIHVVHPLKQDHRIPNPCGDNNGGCSHLCLLSPVSASGYVCACPDNFVLGTNNATCMSDCLNTQFLCNSEHRCIDQLWVCDGEEDCMLAEDEKMAICPDHRQCDPKYFQCTESHTCLHPSLVCDGKSDCLSDTSDEDNCENTECQTWEFRCSTGRCIPHTDVCDQNEDCADGDDEKPAVCAVHKCYDGYFQCDNGFCIPELWVCDLDNDCGDMSDEPFTCQTRQCENGWFPCLTNYRCVPGWAVCYGGDHCRDNSDELDCELKTCDPLGEFQCQGGQCIPKRWHCDDENDCPDGSDEPFDCTPRKCSESEHKCENDRCIPNAYKCDGDFDCGGTDETDEAGCVSQVCDAGLFQCETSGYCIAEALKCDGRAACEDASDEANCPTRFPGGLWCPEEGFFTCDTTACIPKWWVCDGEDDCTDSSDEKDSYCATVINQCNDEHSRWLCKDGTCILEWERCDGVQHCPDGSDENQMLCDQGRTCDANTEFDCNANGYCIPIQAVCDKRNDCGANAWDEVGCNNGTCGSNRGGCDQQCIDTDGGYYCVCEPGYVTDPARPANCIDFDDCATQPCSQICYNLKGEYNCDCAEGFREDATRPGEGVCVSDGTEFVLIGAEKEIIKYYPKEDRLADFIKNEVLIEGIDYHYDLERVYFVDGDRGDLKEVHKDNDGTDVSNDLGIDNLYSPYYVSLDWVANNLYFTDHGEAGRETGRFRRAAADLRPKVGVLSATGNVHHWREAVIVADRLERPTGLAVNPRKGLLYWTDLGSTINPNAKIEMSWMNGSKRREIDFVDFVQPTGLAVDFNSNDTVYFCDFRADRIGYFGWDGLNVRILASSDVLSAPFSNMGSVNPYQLDVFGAKIYFTTKRTGENYVMVVGKNATNDPPKKVFVKPANTLGGIKVFHKRRYPLDLPNPCARANCADMCVLIPPMENNIIYNGFDCICGSTGRDDVAVNGCDDDNAPPPIKPTEPAPVTRKPTTTRRNDCTTNGCYNGGTCQEILGTCICKADFSGEMCQTTKPTNEAQSGQNVLAYGVAAGVVFLLLLLLVLAVFILVCYVKRKKRSAKPVVYRTGANVEIAGEMPAPIDAGEPIYEAGIPRQPVTFENPGYGPQGAQAAGGDDPEKTGLPPGFADVLPEKVDLNAPEGHMGGMGNPYTNMPIGVDPYNQMVAPPEPPPAYTEEDLKELDLKK